MASGRQPRAAAIDRTHEFPWDVAELFRAHDLFGLYFAEADGGAGASALAGLVAMCVHGITLIGDRWLHPGAAGVLVPFVISYRPLAVASGIVAAYLSAALGLSFYVKRRVGAARWRKLHQFTMLAWALGLVHAFFAGTDAPTLWLRLVLLWTAVPIVVLFAVRVTATRRRAARRAPMPRAASSR